jgi:hypothetical protein
MSGIEALWNTIKSWATANATHCVVEPIPLARTDLTGSDAPLVPYKSYMRLWLADMFLAKSRNWFTDEYPAVHTSVQLKFGSEPVKISHVTDGSGQIGRGIFQDYALTDLMPFNGGIVEIQSGLIALKGTNYLKGTIGILKDFSGLVGAPLGQTLDIAEKVSTGLQNLFTDSKGEVALAFHKQYVAAGGGGGELRPGYIALVAADPKKFKQDKLSVEKSRLLYAADGNKPEVLEGYDYMLLRVEGRSERDNWRMKNIEEPLNQAIEETLKRNFDKANEYKTAALLVIFQSPDLAVGDRRRVADAIEAELKEIAGGAQQLVGGKPRSLDDIMKARAPKAKAGGNLPPLTYAEIVGA